MKPRRWFLTPELVQWRYMVQLGQYEGSFFLFPNPDVSCCRNCEYWDCGGETYRKFAALGDCLNPKSPRFTTEPEFLCGYFYPDPYRFGDGLLKRFGDGILNRGEA